MSESDDIEKRTIRAMSRDMSETSLGIEERSMEIIESEIGTHGYTESQWSIVRRVIQLTADFDFTKSYINGIIF